MFIGLKCEELSFLHVGSFWPPGTFKHCVHECGDLHECVLKDVLFHVRVDVSLFISLD